MTTPPSAAPHRVAQHSAARHRGRLAGLLFVLVWLSCAWFGSWEWNPNNATRLFAALSIVEDGDATIDEYAPLTVDKAKFGQHYYLDKAPGITLMALPSVWLVDRMTGQTAHDVTLSVGNYASEHYLRQRLRPAAASGAALLTAIAAVLVFLMAGELGGSEAAGAFAAVGFALGTPMWGWSTSLFGHAPVAALLMIATWAVWRGTEEDTPSLGHAALAGVALGWAVVVEYPALIEGAPLGVWALWRLWRYPSARRTRALVAAVVPALVAAAILLGYNQFAFGTPFRVGYSGVVGFEGMDEGLFGLTYPKPHVLYEILVGGHRGMLWVAPVLGLGAYGLWRLLRMPGRRDVAVMAIASVVVVFVYNASYAYWDGGNATGPRHAVPAMGFLALGLAPAWAALRSRAMRAAALALLAVSIAINLTIASAEIASGGKGKFPLFSDVIHDRFLQGQLRTIPNEWWGYTAFEGLALYLLLAGLIGIALVAQLVRPGGAWRTVPPAALPATG